MCEKKKKPTSKKDIPFQFAPPYRIFSPSIGSKELRPIVVGQKESKLISKKKTPNPLTHFPKAGVKNSLVSFPIISSH